jgi:hypothetical protein
MIPKVCSGEEMKVTSFSVGPGGDASSWGLGNLAEERNSFRGKSYYYVIL